MLSSSISRGVFVRTGERKCTGEASLPPSLQLSSYCVCVCVFVCGRGLITGQGKVQGFYHRSVTPQLTGFLQRSLLFGCWVKKKKKKYPKINRQNDESGSAEVRHLHRECGRHVAGAAVRQPVSVGPAARHGASAENHQEDQVQEQQHLISHK